MDVMDLASKAVRGITARYGKKIRRDTLRPVIERNAPIAFGGEQWRLGFAKRELMPELNEGKTYYIAGHGSGHVMKDVATPVYVSAVWLDCGRDEGIVWIAADIVGLTNVEVEVVRNRIRSSHVIRGCKNVIFSCSHSHSGIDTVGYWGKPFASIPADGKDHDYMEQLFSVSQTVAEDAYLHRKPGRLYSGKAKIPGGLFSKRINTDRHEVLSRLRFRDADGNETWMVNVGAHPNSLGGDNRSLSGEYPYYLRDYVKEQTGAQVLFGIGAIGGMDAADFDEPDLWQRIRKQGEFFAKAAIGIKEDEERELQPEVRLLRRQFYLPVDNNVLAFLAILGTMSFTPYPDPNAATGIAMKTEMTYMTLGDQKLLFLPGESFVPTVYGGYLPAERSATGQGEEVNPMPLAMICEDENLTVYGVTNDMTGYSVEPNNFILNPTQPYLNTATDRFGERHYHETNSMGPKTAYIIADTFRDVVEDFAATK